MNTIEFFDRMWSNFDNFFTNDQVFQINYPPMNVWVEEETKDLFLEFAVAGIPRDNINIDVEGDYLLLEIDKVEDNREGFRLIQKGIKNSKIKNKIYIPVSKYNTGNIKAEMRDGILAVKIPAKESIKPKRILIE